MAELSSLSGAKESRPGRTGVAVLPVGDIGGPRRALAIHQERQMRLQPLSSKDRPCVVKSHILRVVALLRRTPRI